MYLAITQGMAEWLLPKTSLINSLCESFVKTDTQHQKSFTISEGPIKISFSSKDEMISMWHEDYLIGNGDESVGLIKIHGDLSLQNYQSFSRESLERAIYIINQRLQGLLIDGAFYHRKHAENIHTLIAGRGSEARQYSLSYYDSIDDGEYDIKRNILIIGPSDSFKSLVINTEKHKEIIATLTNKANRLISSPFQETPKTDDLIALKDKIKLFFTEPRKHDFSDIEVKTSPHVINDDAIYKTLNNSYESWMDESSQLTETQRRILNSEALDCYPIRIIGPGGSGKTLLMQLLAVHKLYTKHKTGHTPNILYVVHSDKMRSKVINRFETLLVDNQDLMTNIVVTTLSEYSRKKLDLDIQSILDPDATDAKKFQLEQVEVALKDVSNTQSTVVTNSPFLSSIFNNSNLLKVFSVMVLAEISIAIKGHGLEDSKRRYVESDRSFSRLHGVLNASERDFIFSVFENYHHNVFETYNVLDPDDLAISLYGSLKTPIWRMKRKTEGFDYVFVDEAQLFNENERRLFSLLSKQTNSHIPIALALDEAQSFYGQNSSGFATLGILDISNERLESIHRSSKDIAKLAFFIIQRSTNLFSSDFPDFTQINEFRESHRCHKPKIEKEGNESPSFERFLVRKIRELRRENIRQIAVICHLESYWEDIEKALSNTDLPLQILRERGEKIRSEQPTVVLCRPAQVGGQEFDAVIIIGLEKGALSLSDNPALSSAIEQQMIRESYLSVTRAKQNVIFAIPKLATENDILSDAVSAGLLDK